MITKCPEQHKCLDFFGCCCGSTARFEGPVGKSSYFLGDPPPDPRFLASLGALSSVELHHKVLDRAVFPYGEVINLNTRFIQEEGINSGSSEASLGTWGSGLTKDARSFVPGKETQKCIHTKAGAKRGTGGRGGGGGGGARFARGLVKLVMPACHHVATDLAETPAKESSTYSFYVVRIAIAMTMTWSMDGCENNRAKIYFSKTIAYILNLIWLAFLNPTLRYSHNFNQSIQVTINKWNSYGHSGHRLEEMEKLIVSAKPH